MNDAYHFKPYGANLGKPIIQDVLRADTPANMALGNPSSVHEDGRKARVLIEDARGRIANLLSTEASSIWFGANTLEFVAQLLLSTRKRNDSASCALLVTEDSSTAVRLTSFAKGMGIPLHLLSPVNCPQHMDYAAWIISEIKSRNCNFASIPVALSNGEIVLDYDLSTKLRAEGICVHADAGPAIGCLPLSYARLGCDFLSFDALQSYAGGGIAACAAFTSQPLEALFYGGMQERKKRSGTEAVSRIHALGVGAEMLTPQKQTWQELSRHRLAIEAFLQDYSISLMPYPPDKKVLSNTLAISLPVLANIQALPSTTIYKALPWHRQSPDPTSRQLLLSCGLHHLQTDVESILKPLADLLTNAG